MKKAKKKTKHSFPVPEERVPALTQRRNAKMARSAHAFVRGSTTKFYEWLDTAGVAKIPVGPAIWICGDCHIGNLGPVANTDGNIEIQIRDLDQTVIGNPAHDLLRLGLSLATAARGSDLPGVTTAKMMEQLIEGYEQEFDDRSENAPSMERPECIRMVMKQALNRTWKHLAVERIENTKPVIPLGKHFWPLSKDESKAIQSIFEKKTVARLATSLRSREENAEVSLVDAAYWIKGCSSLGKLRFAALLDVNGDQSRGKDICLIDIKEATKTAAPRAAGANMPREHGARVVEGARHLSPHLGERMLAGHVLERSVFIRELLPQDLKLEIDRLNRSEAMLAARYVASVVGKAHARQMDMATRTAWRKELQRNRSKKLNAPSWLWSCIVDLSAAHEAAYLEHCRRYAMELEIC